MKFTLFLVIFLYSFSVKAIHITFVNPSISGYDFWDRVTYAFLDAAKDLNVNVEVLYGQDNRVFNHQKIVEITNKAVKPDYVIFMPYSGNAKAAFDLLEEHEIPFITLERTLPTSEQQALGFPQQQYKYWLGELYHDNEYAGELLANTLIKAAKSAKNKPDKVYSAVGLMGTYGGESEHRVDGLEKSIATHANIELLQTAPGFWNKEKSEIVFQQMIQRYTGTKIDIAWAASDGMALGIAKIAEKYNSDGHIKIGGIDWTQDAIAAINNGQITASVGGHFMQAAWALIRVFDHHHNKDVFLQGENKPTYHLEAVTQENIKKHMFLMEKINWDRVDFKQYSLVFNDKNTHDFSVTSFVDLFTKDALK